MKSYSLGMLIEVYDEKPLAIEGIINALFNESLPLKERVITYKSDFESVIKQMADAGHSDWKGRENLKSYQDVHAISVYLATRYPRVYYIYKWGVFKDFSNAVGYDIQSKNDVERYLEFNELCKVVKEELKKEDAFISFYNNWLKAHDFEDSEFNLLTQDFIYSVSEYLSSNQDSKDEKEKNLKIKLIKHSIIQIEATEFQSVSTKTSKTFKAVKNKDYAKEDQLFRSLGLLGEKWVIVYEQQRLEELGINRKIIHTSVEEGDGKGYDIESVEDDGKTPRYIEVKTTTGCVDQPFYYSDNELQFSELKKKHFYVYRVYNFKGEDKKADLLIVHGSMKDLNGKPVSYKVSVKK